MKKVALTTFLFSILPSVAIAHHPLSGVPMETFMQGLLSGFGHPILGFDHLFFVSLVGISALYTGRAYTTPLLYIAAMLLGSVLMGFGFGLPAKEIFIGLSLITLGVFVLSGKALNLPAAFALFVVFGLFHGSAFGDAIAGEEGAIGEHVLIGYLIGLGVVQYVISVGSGFLMRRLCKTKNSAAVEPRLAGAMVAGIGLFLSLENAEEIVFEAMSWAT